MTCGAEPDIVRGSRIKTRSYPFEIRMDQDYRRSEEKEINRFDVPADEKITRGYPKRKVESVV